MTEQIEGIRQTLLEDGELSKLVPFRISKRNQNDKQRLAKLSNYAQPDPETLGLLVTSHSAWLANPGSFWDRPSPSIVTCPNPQAHIVGRYLQAVRDDV